MTVKTATGIRQTRLSLAGKYACNHPFFIYLLDQPQVSLETFAPETGFQNALVFGGQISIYFGGMSIPIVNTLVLFL